MKVLFIIAIVGIFVLSGCTQQELVGDDVDEHGCIPSAGYSWCEAKQKCLKSWEEPCENVQAVGCSEMTEEEALEIAKSSACGDAFKCSCPEGYTAQEGGCYPDCYFETPPCGAPVIQCGPIVTCNEGTKTYWVDLDLEKPGCNPACVIDVVNKSAEINWRCTGLGE